MAPAYSRCILFVCYLCGSDDVLRPSDGKLRFDHVIPRSHGGTDGADNLRLCCRPCNRLKGHWSLEDFRLVCLSRLTSDRSTELRRFRPTTKLTPDRLELYRRIVQYTGWADAILARSD